MKIHYAGHQPSASGFGWATCNNALVRELSKEAVICGYNEADVVFNPIISHELSPVLEGCSKPSMGYCFFEGPLGPYAEKNAMLYDVIFAGSSWCMKRLAERGITNTKLLIQGVDETIFHPVPPRQPDGQYRIFSGGKFEYRKGQDLVIAAFREFAKVHPAAHLVCAWHNPWPLLVFESLRQMTLEWKLEPKDILYYFFTRLLIMNGIRPDQFTILPQLPQAALALAMENTDVGLFPNRCEGGTNLVMMEYAATGREVVANALTGHADVREAITTTIYAYEDEQHWAKSSVENVVDALCAAYQCRHTPAPNPPAWPWSVPAAIVLQTARELLGARA